MSSSNSNLFDYTIVLRLNLGSLLGILLLLISIDISDASAQIGQLRVGDRIRITAPLILDEKIKGTVTELDKTVVVLAAEDSSYYISESMIQHLETSNGKKRVLGRGLVIGAVTGTAMFGLASAFANNACGPGDSCLLARRDGEAYMAGASIGLIAGAAVGTVAGFFTRVDMWERVHFRIAMDATPIPTGFDQKKVNPAVTFRFPISR